MSEKDGSIKGYNLKNQNVKKIRLGDLLINLGYLTSDQLQYALKVQQKHGGKLGYILMNLGYIDEKILIETLAKQLNIPLIDLKTHPINIANAQKLPENIARQCRGILIEGIGYQKGEWLIGMADPTDLMAYDEIICSLKKEARTAIVLESDLMNTLDEVYRYRQQE